MSSLCRAAVTFEVDTFCTRLTFPMREPALAGINRTVPHPRGPRQKMGVGP
ncbi:hypothetical protein GTA62_11735 [Roseobacter sp. HKCCD9010]|uniref:hypothetical protein n=1 Tax=unclassified Roseobacter TaxID=196798 RepID=UPI001492D928|nr:MULTISPECIES: hypothetical protein [unclassified Roseobacter]NNV16147.1 hypothetical protein [Roseobacter sp. HKCCD8768]NNV25607.1 hypothetical protein [Roseobacter sp. HKCCD8192]NNV29863.1 hypothetical protein [Roseobacter sp. HKCCD9061]NNV34321.1 hypothetical protein [Roseobacter sp. HKCCD9073]NNV63918.1 hypothetical protein [Roseobacter sp. HKCCD8434]NNV68176.1 hypothetical protein [Roseobacter sp. HKCCD8474]NNV72442.1 hypothetical protein [Roseobacter sp. HKCCD5932]NNV97995.1 hypothe